MDWAARYRTSLADIFSRGHKLTLEHRVELALLKALGDEGRIPKEAHEELRAKVDGVLRKPRDSAALRAHPRACSAPRPPLLANGVSLVRGCPSA